MGVIGIWPDGLEDTDVADLLPAVGHEMIRIAVGSAFPGAIDVLVADVRTVLAQAGQLAACQARGGERHFSVLAVMAATANDAAVQAVLAVADEVIRRPVGAAELTARLGRLLACREQTLAMGKLRACGDGQQAALAAATADLSRRVKALHCLSEVHAVIQRFGQPREQLFQGIAALIPPAMHRPEAIHARVLADGGQFVSPDFRQGPCRLRFPLAGSGQPDAALEVFSDEGDPDSVGGSFHADEVELVRLVAQRLDRTLARLGAEAALAREREFSALLMNTLPGGVVRLNRAGAIVFCNPRAAAVLELQNRNLGSPAYDDPGFGTRDVDGGPLAAGEHPFARVLATGRPVYDMVLSLARPVGGRRFVSMSAAPLFAPDGAVDEVVLSLVDVTGQKSMERQLAHALKMESLGQLAAGIAHEINTPVQYVGGNLEFLGNTFGRLLELLDKLAASALAGQGEPQGNQRLAEELAELLGDEELRFLLEETPAAIQESKEGLDRVAAIVLSMKRFAHPGNAAALPVDVAQAVADTLAVSRSAWKFAADVSVEIDADVPPVLFVPGDFNQILLNIVVNAAQAVEEKFAPTGRKGHIAIRAAQSAGGVELVIADDGPGIPAAIRQRIFDPFFTTKPVGKGTGQGLAIVHSLVERHKAGLEVLSKPGEGTSFVLRLPVAEQAKIGL
ncbi:two-component system sensor histidine kinase NtrB [Desulfovibrio sp. TomC]|uniref:two-component system sensor histidine kinase NtrB n=1 Tax=Desulfovibrio sp. TomC TaxID=1562888 RepID=UPI000573A6F7|nr:ATP-binding protein [Desulfovibrio sp. TomC]KHK04004.1 Signal transduction histidine kinase [Desulfovibrio sp. TomC]